MKRKYKDFQSLDLKTLNNGLPVKPCQKYPNLSLFLQFQQVWNVKKFSKKNVSFV